MALRAPVAILIAAALAAPAALQAETRVYRNLDAGGGVTYSDRPQDRASAQVRMWTPANPSSYEYSAAQLRSESDRIYYLRQRAEDARPRPIVTYSPRRADPLPGHRYHYDGR